MVSRHHRRSRRLPLPPLFACAVAMYGHCRYRRRRIRLPPGCPASFRLIFSLQYNKDDARGRFLDLTSTLDFFQLLLREEAESGEEALPGRLLGSYDGGRCRGDRRHGHSSPRASRLSVRANHHRRTKHSPANNARRACTARRARPRETRAAHVDDERGARLK